MSVSIHQQLHGYRNGHQLLQSSVRLNYKDQDLIDHLSDMAGPLRPGENFDAYVSAYPLPSLKYYALARTEQDLNAPRAGCVTTKTLLVPMDFWESEASPASFTVLLKGPAADEPIHVSAKPQVLELAPVDNPALAELVEALFLEKRRAIVVFGVPSPEEVALRLLTAFWPNMRRNFSLCTFALSPRTLAGESFDLLFAPKSARTRFSGWEGRRIEAEEKADGERHRWTSGLMQRIFYDPVPHLLDKDSLRALMADDDEESESVLRLSLLWDELCEKATRSPTAVLGLIDIASSRSAVASTWQVLEPAIANAITTAAESLETKNAWNFLTALLGKLESEPLTGLISQALNSAGTKLTQRDWGSALTYLADEALIESRNSEELIQSVATSLATVDSRQLTQALVAVPPERLLKIALLDDRMLARLFSASDSAVDAALIQSLTQGFQSLAPEERSRQRLRLLSHIRGDQDSEILAQIIADAQTPQLVEAIDLIWGANARRTPHIGEILCTTATATGSRLEVRTALARLSDDDQTNRCIERLIVADPADVRWLLENTEIRNRRTFFLNSLIERSSPDNLERAFSSVETATKALHLLAGDLKRFASTSVRIVVLPSIAVADHITLGLEIYPMLQDAERTMLAQSMVSRVLTDTAAQGDDLPERVIATVIGDIDLPAVITIGLGTNQNGQQVSRTLVAFDRVSPAARTLLEAHVALIVQLVASRRTFDLTTNGAIALARLIEAAAQLNRRTHVEICSTILPFAMAARRKPASQIIIAAFPTAYEELRKDRENFGLINLFSFLDWDKCKMARKDLVLAFTTSKWPPVDLAITALRARELNKILKRLLKEPGGPNYLARVEEGARRLEEAVRKPVLKAIKEVRTSGDFSTAVRKVS